MGSTSSRGLCGSRQPPKKEGFFFGRAVGGREVPAEVNRKVGI